MNVLFYFWIFINLIPFLCILIGLILALLWVTKKILKKEENRSIKKEVALIVVGLGLYFIQNIPRIFYNFDINVCNEYPSHMNFYKTEVKRCVCRGGLYRYEPAIDAGAKEFCLGFISKTYKEKAY